MIHPDLIKSMEWVNAKAELPPLVVENNENSECLCCCIEGLEDPYICYYKSSKKIWLMISLGLADHEQVNVTHWLKIK